MPPKINGRNTKDIGLKGVGVPTYKSLDKFLNAFGSAGIFEGGTITDSGSGQIDVAAASGVIRTSDSETGEIVSFDVAITTNISLTDNSMNYIYIDYNSGSPIYAVTTDYNSINFNTQIIVGRVYRSGTILNIANIGQYIVDHILRDLYRLQYVRRLEWGSGAALGFTAATRQPTVGAGVYFSNYSKVTTAAFNASGSDRFTYWYRNGSGGWTQVTSQQNIDNLNYDSGTGTLTTLGIGDYGVHWVYQLTDGSIQIQYGQATYTSIANARNSTVPSSQPPVVVGMGILIGRIIILKNATVIYETSSAFTYTFTGTATTNHDDLANILGGGTYHLSAPSAPSTARYRNVTAIDNGETVRSNKALFDDGSTPAMNGSASTGTAMEVSRRDHVHPSDTSREPAITTLATTKGGTGLNSYTSGDLLYASATDTLAKLAASGNGSKALVMNSGATAPEYVHAKRTVFLSLAGGWNPTTSPAGNFTTTETSTNKVNVRGTTFAAGSSNIYHEFATAMPDNWDLSTVTAEFYFHTTSTDASDHTIIFGLQGLALSDGDTLDTAYGTAQEATETVSSAINGKMIKTSATSAITIGNTPAKGDFVQWRVYRKGSDTFSGDIILLGIRISYGTNNYSDV